MALSVKDGSVGIMTVCDTGAYGIGLVRSLNQTLLLRNECDSVHLNLETEKKSCDNEDACRCVNELWHRLPENI